MIPLAGLAVLFGTAVAFGRACLDRTTKAHLSRLERTAYGAPIGFGVAGYATTLLAYLHLLRPWCVAAMWAVMLAVGARSALAIASDGREAIRRLRTTDFLNKCAFAAIGVLCVLLLICCYRPPGGREWDALSYHLADVKQFIAAGRIVALPTEHHSNFPFTIEMLFASGLMFGGYVLANMLHLGTAIATAAMLVAIGRRCSSTHVGLLAALLFLFTPLVAWEATVAYIDVAFGMFVLGAVACAVLAVDRPHDRQSYLALSAVFAGFALGTKYLALLPVAVLIAYLVAAKVPARDVVRWAVLVIVVGSPWYVRNAVVMRNPVYPFAYSLFRHSRYWSADRAAAYSAEQASFGLPHSLQRPASALQGALVVPWYLVADGDRFANKGDFHFFTLAGGLVLALFCAFPLAGRAPPTQRGFWTIAAALALGWFFSAQVGRYLASVIPVAAVPAAWLGCRLMGRQPATGGGSWLATCLNTATRVGIAGNLAVVLGAVALLPSGAATANRFGLPPSGLELGVSAGIAVGINSPSRWLARYLDVYRAESWINANTPKSSTVGLIDETRSYYIDRGVMWANPQHSSYIPYATMRDSSDLAAWLRRHGVQTLLLNAKLGPVDAASQLAHSDDMGSTPRLWYTGTLNTPEAWRNLYGGLVAHKLWSVAFAANGVVVLVPSG